MAREVVSGLFEIDTRALGHERIVAAFLVKGDEKTALIDPGFPSSAETVATEVANAGVDPANLDYIVLTHTHIDHAGAAGQWAQRATKAVIVTHKRGVFYLRNAGKISGGARMVFDPSLADGFGEPIDIPGHRIRPVLDGHEIALGDKALVVYYTPGHASNHISLFEKATGALFPGDTCCLNYPQLRHVLIPAGSPPVYPSGTIMDELHRLSTLDAQAVLTPHFGEAVSTPAAFLQAKIEAVAETRRQIVALFGRGLEFQQVVETLRADILERSGRARGEVPDFLADVWLRAMLKTGLMGSMADILEYAKDLRPFHATSAKPAEA